MKKLPFTIAVILFSLPALAKPLIIAHRGGGQNWPENTLAAFQGSQQLGVDIIELDVQLTKEGIPVLYHAKDLSQKTAGKGPVGKRTLAYVQKLGIPTLAEVLQKIQNIPIIVDMKSLPAEPLARALAQQIPETEWKRLLFYSTNKEHLEWIHKLKPAAVTFESRKTTRERLLEFANAQKCDFKSEALWLAFEQDRKMNVVEKFTLGEESDEIDFKLWTPQSIACVRKMAPKAKIVLIGINTKKDLKKALQLNVDGVYTDNPKELLTP